MTTTLEERRNAATADVETVFAVVLAEVLPDFSYKILDRFKNMARLGDGAFGSQHLSDEAITRSLAVIRHLVTLAKNKGYDRLIAVATSAVREAKNGGDFIDLVKGQTGLTVRVITGTEEARLIFLGIQNSVPMTEQPVLGVDVGGGRVVAGGTQHVEHGFLAGIGLAALLDRFHTLRKHVGERR